MHLYFNTLGRTISGYALMGLVGFAAAVACVFSKCRRSHLSYEDAIYIFALSMVGMIVGAKALYLLTAIPEIMNNWRAIAAEPSVYLYAYLSGGFVFYGGLFGGLLAAKATANYFHIPLSSHYDAFVPAIPLFAGFGRLGCLMEGCCYGKATKSPLSIVFHTSLFAPNEVPLIPTQLYEAIFDFILFGLLYYLSNKRQWASKLLEVYLIAYASFRFVIEFWRGDSIRGVFLLSTSQWISLAILCAIAINHIRTRFERKSFA